MPSRLLKTKASLPYNLEHRLITHWGYVMERREAGQYILFKKNYISDKVANDIGVKRTIRASVNAAATAIVETKVLYHDFKSQLTTQQRKALERRCDNIVNFFPDPYSVTHSVRARLMISMQKMSMPEAQFVQEYMNENFPLVDTGK